MFQKNALIGLVRSLNKAEVRHFALTSKIYEKSGGKAYYKLFCSLRKQTLCDSDNSKIEKKINDSTIEKYHLFTRLSDSLLDFHKKKNVRFNILNNIKLMTIFGDKGMVGEALGLGDRIKKMCYEYELYDHVITVVNQQLRLIENHQVQRADSLRTALVNEYSSVLMIHDSILKLEHARLMLFDLFNKNGIPVTAGETEPFSDLLIPIKELEFSASVLLRSKFYRLINSYYHVLKDFESAEKYQFFHYRLFEQHPQFKENNILEYILFLYYYIQNLLYLKQYQKANKLIAELKICGLKYGQKDLVIKTEIETRLTPLELYYSLCQGDFQGIIAKEDHYRSFIEKYKTQLRSFTINSFIYNLSHAYFMTNNFGKINRLLGSSDIFKETSEKIALFYNLRLIHIIALLETKENDAAQSILASLTRYIKLRKGTPDCTEIKILKLVEYQYLKKNKGKSEIQEDDITKIKAFLKDSIFIKHWLEKHAYCRRTEFSII